MPNVGFVLSRQTLPDNSEQELAQYLEESSKMYFGLSTKEVRVLAYEIAVKNNIKMRQYWQDNKMASTDWLAGFLKRHPTLSVRTPEATSLSRATSFNRENVNKFFNLLGELMERYRFECQDIYNLDETGVTTVQRPDRIIARKGVKQVGFVTSAERGTLVTVVAAISASGNAIPPRDDFFIFLEHFVKHTRPSKERPVLLVLDNHDSHLSLKGVDFCKDNGLVVLSLPPHCSHKLQPLDRCVFSPFKKYVNSKCDSWMRSNPGKTMSIYDIPGIVRDAFPLAPTPTNIQSGFRVSGIFPFNREIFTDDEFLTSAVTDRPYSPPVVDNVQDTQTQNNNGLQEADNSLQGEFVPEPRYDREVTPPQSKIRCVSTDELPGTSGVTKHFSPSDIRPLPKAGSRQLTNKGRKCRKACILTDTPNKDELAAEEEKRAAKLRQSALKAKKNSFGNANKKKPENANKKKPKNKKQAKKMEQQAQSSSDEENVLCLICCEPYSNSLPGETWIKCTRCAQWAHEQCADNDTFFICQNCDSDDDA